MNEMISLAYHLCPDRDVLVCFVAAVMEAGKWGEQAAPRSIVNTFRDVGQQSPVITFSMKG